MGVAIGDDQVLQEQYYGEDTLLFRCGIPSQTRNSWWESSKCGENQQQRPHRAYILRHYIVLIARHEYSEDEDELPSQDLEAQPQESKKEEWDRMQQTLRLFHLNLINYALEKGYSYTRWQTIANTILFKDTDNVRLHRTRVIHIYEADYNLVSV